MNIKQIAKERIKILFSLAKKNPKRSRRYIFIANKISMKAQIPLKSYKENFCKHCLVYFTPNNTRIRIKNKVRIKTCLECGKETRKVYS